MGTNWGCGVVLPPPFPVETGWMMDDGVDAGDVAPPVHPLPPPPLFPPIAILPLLDPLCAVVLPPLGKGAVCSGAACPGAAVGWGPCPIAMGSGDKITCNSVPVWSTTCCTMWPGGTCIGNGIGGDEFVDTIRIVAGPTKREGRHETNVNNWLSGISLQYSFYCCLYPHDNIMKYYNCHCTLNIKIVHYV